MHCAEEDALRAQAASCGAHGAGGPPQTLNQRIQGHWGAFYQSRGSSNAHPFLSPWWIRPSLRVICLLDLQGKSTRDPQSLLLVPGPNLCA